MIDFNSKYTLVIKEQHHVSQASHNLSALSQQSSQIFSSHSHSLDAGHIRENGRMDSILPGHIYIYIYVQI